MAVERQTRSATASGGRSKRNTQASITWTTPTAQITCKNPSDEQLATLAKIAFAQGWRLRGDDGEYYDDNGRVIVEVTPKQGIFAAIKNIFAERRAARELAAEMEGVESVFKVGDRVKSIHRSGGVVIKVDKAGNSGLGQDRRALS